MAGTIGDDAQINLEYGIDGYYSLVKSPCTLQEAMNNADDWLSQATEQMMRALWEGYKMAGGRAKSRSNARARSKSTAKKVSQETVRF